MKRNKPLLPAFCFLLFLLTACSVDLPSYVISQGKMEHILYDYHLAQGMAEAQGGDVQANRYLYVQKVFEKYHITEAEFDTSMVWYSGHASHLDEMYARIDARLERESFAAGLNIPEEDKFAHYTAEGDTANIWQGRDMVFLQGNREENLYTIVMPADTSFHRGDYFMLRFGNRFVVADNQREAYALVQIRYDNDSVVAGHIMLNGDHDINLSIPQEKVLKDHDVKSVTCTFYYYFNENLPDAFRLWVVNKPILLRYHAQPEEKKDSLPTDSIVIDSLPKPSKSAPTRPERLSPEEFRSTQQVDKKINVVEKRRVVLPSKRPQNQSIKRQP